MHIKRVLIKAQESFPMAFKTGKTSELPGVLPLEPRRGVAPGSHP